MQQRTMLWMVFSFLMLLFASLATGCAGVPKPKAYVCVVNAPAQNRKCYNLETDYDENGNRKPEAKAIYRSNVTIDDLNKAMVIDSATGFEDGLAELKAYIKLLREAYEAEKEKNRQCADLPPHDGGH
jgi:hypothetical protein